MDGWMDGWMERGMLLTLATRAISRRSVGEFVDGCRGLVLAVALGGQEGEVGVVDWALLGGLVIKEPFALTTSRGVEGRGRIVR